MFTFNVRTWWNPEPIKAKLEQQGKEAARLCAEYVAERARVYCPVKTGDLRASIVVKPSMNGTVFHVMATMPYAGMVEFGTTHDTYFIAPQPFLRKALADGRKKFPELLKTVGATWREGEHLGATIRA